MTSARNPRSQRFPVTHFAEGTWIECEDAAGPKGAMLRRGKALVHDESSSKLRAVRASIPDSYISIPAKTKMAFITGPAPNGAVYAEFLVNGFISIRESDGALEFTHDGVVPLQSIQHPDNLNNPHNYTASGRLRKGIKK